VARKTFEYRLLVQKQAGMDRDQVRVAVEIPASTRLLQAWPKPVVQQGRWVAFDFLLDSDKEVSVVFKASAD
jgi:hypothetical protein